VRNFVAGSQTSEKLRLLIADGDADLRRSVAGFMSARGYEIDQTASGIEAANLLGARHINVLIADLAVQGKSGLELLEFAKRAAPTTRSVVLGTGVSGRDRESALRLGAVRVLLKPVSLLELADAVAVAADCGDGFYGWLHRLSLVDVLQMYHLAGHSLTLSLRGPVEGKIVLNRGQIVHAECEGEVGEPALVRLLRARRGSIDSEPMDHLGATISAPFEHVILDSIRLVDEGKQRSSWPRIRAAAGESWLGDLREPATNYHLRRWLETHAPGASAWLRDAETGAVSRVGGVESTHESATEPSSVGVAFALAEQADSSWGRVELSVGGLAIALLRRGKKLLAFVRTAADEDLLRRFRFEVTQLSRWWNAEGYDAE
jgi:CheY-like chemotaxis protein